MPSMFSLSSPPNLFQVWFVVYVYLLPFLLYATWASLSLMDLSEAGADTSRLGWAALVVLVPLLGGGWYLLSAARTLNRSARISVVALGLIVWLLPLAVGFWLVGGPLGPKALN